MYLIDTNVISEIRKGKRANIGVTSFFQNADEKHIPIYLSVITIGELWRGVKLLEYRQDSRTFTQLQRWFQTIIDEYKDFIIPFETDEAHIWAELRVPHQENSIDKQIAATALSYGFTVVTRNDQHFKAAGLSVLNPFLHTP